MWLKSIFLGIPSEVNARDATKYWCGWKASVLVRLCVQYPETCICEESVLVSAICYVITHYLYMAWDPDQCDFHISLPFEALKRIVEDFDTDQRISGFSVCCGCGKIFTMMVASMALMPIWPSYNLNCLVRDSGTEQILSLRKVKTSRLRQTLYAKPDFCMKYSMTW